MNYITDNVLLKSKSYTDTYGSTTETPRKNSAQMESVHSSSDRDLRCVTFQKLPKIEEEEKIDVSWKMFEFLRFQYNNLFRRTK